jgi:hypothetical protein
LEAPKKSSTSSGLAPKSKHFGQKVLLAQPVGQWILEIRSMPTVSVKDKRFLVLSGFPECGRIELYLNGFMVRRYPIPVYGKRV